MKVVTFVLLYINVQVNRNNSASSLNSNRSNSQIIIIQRGENMAMWNPWRGCKRCSDGCLYCYIHKGDAKRGVDTGIIEKTKDFSKPIERLKNDNYKMKSGIVYTCFSTDFLIEEADAWRKDCWQMIKERKDCTFLFLTKRIDRFSDCIPDDWLSLIHI